MSDAPRPDPLRERFVRYQELRAAHGDARAKELLLARETERERAQMGPLIRDRTLAKALTLAIPVFEGLGMRMRVVDVSNRGSDAALEIQERCPYAELAREFGVGRPCTLTCELDAEAVMRAFPPMRTKLVSCQADGDCTCIFKHERPAPPPA